MTRLEEARWVLVRARGNMALDDELGRFKTREEAIDAIPGRGIYQLWLENGDRLVDGSWEEVSA